MFDKYKKYILLKYIKYIKINYINRASIYNENTMIVPILSKYFVIHTTTIFH